jgi:hypothetical protein
MWEDEGKKDMKVSERKEMRTPHLSRDLTAVGTVTQQ